MTAQPIEEVAAHPTTIAGLARQTGLYGLGAAASVAASAAYLPIYTLALTPAEFGRLVTVQAFAAVIRIVAPFGVQLGMFRYLCAPPVDRAGLTSPAIVSNATVVAVCGSVAVCGAAAAIGHAAAGTGLLKQSWSYLVDITALVVLAGVMRDLAELVMRGSGRARLAVFYSSTYLLLNVPATLVAFALIGHTAAAAQWSTFIVAAGFGALGLPVLIAGFAPRLVRPAAMRPLLRYGVPQMPALLLDWVSQFIDRFFIGAYMGVSEVGVYSLGSRLGMLVQQVGNVASMSGWDAFSAANHRRENAAWLLGRVTTYLLLAVMVVVVGLGVGAGPLFDVIGAGDKYDGAAGVVFLIALSYWFSLARHLFLSTVSLKLRPELSLIALGLTAIANVGLNFALIPNYGIYGAAIATLITCAFGALAGLAIGRRTWAIEYEWRRLGLLLACAVAAVLLWSAASIDAAPIVDLIVSVAGGIALFAGLLTLSGFFRGELAPIGRAMLRVAAGRHA